MTFRFDAELPRNVPPKTTFVFTFAALAYMPHTTLARSNASARRTTALEPTPEYPMQVTCVPGRKDLAFCAMAFSCAAVSFLLAAANPTDMAGIATLDTTGARTTGGETSVSDSLTTSEATSLTSTGGAGAAATTGEELLLPPPPPPPPNVGGAATDGTADGGATGATVVDGLVIGSGLFPDDADSLGLGATSAVGVGVGVALGVGSLVGVTEGVATGVA